MGSDLARLPRRLRLVLIGMAAMMSACVAEPGAPSPYYDWYNRPYYYPAYPAYYYWPSGRGFYRGWHGHVHHVRGGSHGGHHH